MVLRNLVAHGVIVRVVFRGRMCFDLEAANRLADTQARLHLHLHLQLSMHVLANLPALFDHAVARMTVTVYSFRCMPWLIF